MEDYSGGDQGILWFPCSDGYQSSARNPGLLVKRPQAALLGNQQSAGESPVIGSRKFLVNYILLTIQHYQRGVSLDTTVSRKCNQSLVLSETSA